MTPDKVRVAVVGAGWAGELHLKAFAAQPAVELVAVSSRTEPRARQVADAFGVPAVHTDLDRMLAEVRPDVVSVATPPSSHAHITLAAIAAGCHVLCDKPIATSAADGARMLEAAEAAGVKHASGFVWRNDPAILELRRLVAERAVGDVVEVHARCALGAPVLPMTWMYDAEAGGGALMQHGGHVIDRIRWVTGNEFAGVSGELLHDVKDAEVGPRFHNVMEAFAWAGRRMVEGGEPLPRTAVTADTGYTLRAELANGVRVSLWELWHGVGTHPVGEVGDAGLSLLAALGDHVGRPEGAGDLLARLVARHRDHPLGAHLCCGEDAAEAHRAVADHDDGVSALHAGGDRGVPARRHHVGQGQQGRDEPVVGHAVRGDEAAVGLGHPGVLALSALGDPEVDARRLHARAAVRAGVVAVAERHDHEVTDLGRRDGGADLLHDADALVADGRARADVVLAAVGPQVGAADAACDHLDDGVGGLLDPRVRHVLEADVAGCMDGGCTHAAILPRSPAPFPSLPASVRSGAGVPNLALSHI